MTDEEIIELAVQVAAEQKAAIERFVRAAYPVSMMIMMAIQLLQGNPHSVTSSDLATIARAEALAERIGATVREVGRHEITGQPSVVFDPPVRQQAKSVHDWRSTAL